MSGKMLIVFLFKVRRFGEAVRQELVLLPCMAKHREGIKWLKRRYRYAWVRLLSGFMANNYFGGITAPRSVQEMCGYVTLGRGLMALVVFIWCLNSVLVFPRWNNFMIGSRKGKLVVAGDGGEAQGIAQLPSHSKNQTNLIIQEISTSRIIF